jgi:hypothetical protein
MSFCGSYCEKLEERQLTSLSGLNYAPQFHIQAKVSAAL